MERHMYVYENRADTYCTDIINNVAIYCVLDPVVYGICRC